jgi:ATP-binding cassette subfamily A (ABC1) protein 3
MLISTRSDLTVEEHIRIFSDLKCLSKVNKEVVNDLASGVDLLKKLKKQAKTLSGGQKRKLQMAIMFAGGSAVCCVDEVSTGLDPISRRRIWEILLAERVHRTIIMTTHYLDEADYLADDIAIMFKGTLRASGTSASLKHTYGDGYTIKLPHHSDVELEVSGEFHREHSRHQTVYRVATAVLATELVEQLEKHGINDYQLSGPTMEELFIKVTGETIYSTEESSVDDEKVSNAKESQVAIDVTSTDYTLTEGRPIPFYAQWTILLHKRLLILRRRWIPYFIAVAFAIVGAGIAPLLIKSVTKPLQCPVPADLIDDRIYRSDFGREHYTYQSSYVQPDIYNKQYVFGPADKLTEEQIELMVSIYSTNYTYNYNYDNAYQHYGYHNTTELRSLLLLVDTYDEFSTSIKKNWADVDDYYASSGGGIYSAPFTTIKGGVWMGDETTNPTLLVRVRNVNSANQILNMMNVMGSGVRISGSYYSFAATKIPQLIELKSLMFIIYFGLIMAW